VLTADYRGLHLYATLVAGVAVASGVSGVASRWGRRPRLALAAMAWTLGDLSVVVPPSNAVRIELSRVEGTPLFVPLARWGWGFSHGDARVPPELRAWFEPREHLPQVPPSRPALYGDDLIVLLIGIVSAIVDNVPLVAAAIGMYSLDQYGPNSFLWQFLAYCAGTGGSILIIGSAAGVAAMGLERIDFVWYVKKISGLAIAGYFAGALAYIIQLTIFS